MGKLGQDLDSESGSRSTDLIESGSNPDPDPKHCFFGGIIIVAQKILENAIKKSKNLI